MMKRVGFALARGQFPAPRLASWAAGGLVAPQKRYSSAMPDIEALTQKESKYNLLESLRSDPRHQITREEFDRLCTESGASSSGEWLEAFQNAGVAHSAGDLVYIKPEAVFKRVRVALGIPYDPAKGERVELAKVEAEIEPLLAKKVAIDQAVQHKVNRFFAISTAFVSVVGAGLARLTFIDFNWDVMEPITYFITATTGVGGAYYYWRHRTDYTYTDLEGKMHPKRTLRAYRKAGFDLEQFQRLAIRRAELQAGIASKLHIEEELNAHNLSNLS